ncbi:MAG: prolipoprotein diacylglyceryl transferase [Chthoniobacterales bacterium]
MMAYYIHNLSPFILQFTENFGLRWYGLAYVLAFFVGTLVYRWLAKQGYSDLREGEVADFIIWGAMFGVLMGGRIGYVLFYDLDHFFQEPWSFFQVYKGGMSSHGGMIGLIIYTLVYARVRHVSWLNIGDNLVVVAPIGLFFGRIANFINGELYGRIATNVSWAMQFPAELEDPAFSQSKLQSVVNRAYEINPAFGSVKALVNPHRPAEITQLLAEVLTPRHPSQLYEAFFEGVVLFLALWFLRTRVRLPNGVLTGAFFILYALLRIIGEFFREPDAPLTGWMSRGQFLSLFLIIIGIAFLVGAYLRPAYAPRFKGKNQIVQIVH